jgi:dipeptidyl aminopeptidase/acylaminoacyl peptidase
LEDQGTQRLASVSVNDGKFNQDVTGEKVISDYDLGPSDRVAFIAARPQLPDDLYAFDGTKTKQLAHTNQQLVDSLNLGQMERIHFKSKDGTPVEAFVTKPPGFDPSKKYPAVLWIHGGPTSQYEERFDFGAQLFAANGYVVLYVNPRGSTGYGENFCKAIWADWGNKDFEDVMAGVDYVIAQGYVDPNKLGVGGWSYGGILTDHVITKTDRFKAATTGASESNYLMNYGVDHYQYEWEKEIGLPWEKPENYIRISPFFKLDKIVTPTLVLCGQSDLNVPLVNSEQLYQGLRRRGIDTMLIVYPNQFHGITKPSYQKDRYQRYLAWFGHYLQGAPEKEPAAAPEPAKQGQ